jgi:phosphoribosylformylglycinamidine synthase PurS subunit
VRRARLSLRIVLARVSRWRWANDRAPSRQGLKLADKLDEPIFTPATKAASGHDENITEAQTRELLGNDLYEQLRQRSIDIYTRATEYAAEKGVILADTKFEFGFAGDELLLIDEVLTPDSSRYWPVDEWEPGNDVPSFDKQYVREWLEKQPWDKNPPAPDLPDDVSRRDQSAIHRGLREDHRQEFRRLPGLGMKVTVTIDRRPEIADPEGATVQRALHDLGFTEVEGEVRMDRVIHIEVEGDDPAEVKTRVEEMCRQLLANPVLEDFSVEVEA